MASLIDAPRGADLLLSYIFPTGTDLTGYTAVFTVYAAKNGTSLLAVTNTPNGNGSAFTLNGNILALAVLAADIDALPVNNDDATTSALLWFDLIVTTAAGAICKLYGGPMHVLPYGAPLSPQGGFISVSLGGQPIAIEIAESGFDAALLALAEGYATAAEGSAAMAQTEASAAMTQAGEAAASATSAAASASDAATSADAASGYSSTAASSAAMAQTAATSAIASAANATAAAAAINTVGDNVAAEAVAAAGSATAAQAEAVTATAQAQIATNQALTATMQATAAAGSATSAAGASSSAAGSASAASTAATMATTQATAAGGSATAAATSATAASASAAAAQSSAVSINGVARNAYDPSRIIVWEDNSILEAILAAIDLATGQFSYTPDLPTATSFTNADKAHVDVHGLAHGSGRRMISLFSPKSSATLGTVTTGAADATLTNVYSYSSSSALMYVDGVVAVSGNYVGSKGSYYPNGSGGNLGSFSQYTGKLSVMTNAQKIQFRVLATSPSHFRLYVDGVPACDPTSVGASVGDGTTYVQIDMGSPSIKGRLVTLETELNVGKHITNTVAISPTTGLTVAGTAVASSIWAPDSTYRRKFGFVGDSYSTSTGASSSMLGWLPQLCRLIGGMDCNPIVEGYGGTGYLNPGGLGSGTLTGSVAGNTGTYADPNRISTFTQAGYTPDILAFFGGQNDYSAGASAVQTAVQTTLSAYRSALPGVPFWVAGIWPASDGPSTSKCTVELGIRSAVDALADPLIVFSPLSVISSDGVNPDKIRSMYYGTGHVSAKNGTGPSDFITGGVAGTDTIHPTDDGHRWIAERLYAEFERVAPYFNIAA